MRSRTIAVGALAAAALALLAFELARRDAAGSASEAPARAPAPSNEPPSAGPAGLAAPTEERRVAEPGTAAAPAPEVERAKTARDLVRDVLARYDAGALPVIGGEPGGVVAATSVEEAPEFRELAEKYSGLDAAALRAAFEDVQYTVTWQHEGPFAYKEEQLPAPALAWLEFELAWLKERVLGGVR